MKKRPSWDSSAGSWDQPFETVDAVCSGCVALREDVIEECKHLRERLRRVEFVISNLDPSSLCDIDEKPTTEDA